MSLNRYSPYIFKNGKSTKNRVVVPPMASSTADSNGLATEKTFAHYQRLTESQAGLIFVEYSFVDQSGKSEANQLGAHSSKTVAGLTKIASLIHQSGALAAWQFAHGGGKTTREITGQPLQSPSGVKVPVKGWEPDLPRSVETGEIQNWIASFERAAGFAVDAGFDMIELHSAHGYGLNQWLSPITNTRTDSYGGNLQNRSRLLLETVSAIKRHYPRLLISVRIPGQDHFPGGLQLNDMMEVVTRLETAGVDLINVSSGIGGWRRLDGRNDQGYLVADAAAIKQSTTLPVIGVGGIETGEFIDQILQQHQVDFAAVGRAILKDPKQWSQLNLDSCHSGVLAAI